jgi:hypothetical protein
VSSTTLGLLLFLLAASTFSVGWIAGAMWCALHWGPEPVPGPEDREFPPAGHDGQRTSTDRKSGTLTSSCGTVSLRQEDQI